MKAQEGPDASLLAVLAPGPASALRLWACLPGLHAGPVAFAFVFGTADGILRHGRRGSRLRMIGWRACIADGVVVVVCVAVAGASGLAVSWSARLSSGALLDEPCFRPPCSASFVFLLERCSLSLPAGTQALGGQGEGGEGGGVGQVEGAGRQGRAAGAKPCRNGGFSRGRRLHRRGHACQRGSGKKWRQGLRFRVRWGVRRLPSVRRP